jgi:hypothetical protein
MIDQMEGLHSSLQTSGETPFFGNQCEGDTPCQPGAYQYTYETGAKRRLSQLSIARELGTNSSNVFEIHAAI